MNEKHFYLGLTIALAGVLLFCVWDMQLLSTCMLIGGCVYAGGPEEKKEEEVSHD